MPITGEPITRLAIMSWLLVKHSVSDTSNHGHVLGVKLRSITSSSASLISSLGSRPAVADSAEINVGLSKSYPRVVLYSEPFWVTRSSTLGMLVTVSGVGVPGNSGMRGFGLESGHMWDGLGMGTSMGQLLGHGVGRCPSLSALWPVVSLAST